MTIARGNDRVELALVCVPAHVSSIDLGPDCRAALVPQMSRSSDGVVLLAARSPAFCVPRRRALPVAAIRAYEADVAMALWYEAGRTDCGECRTCRAVAADADLIESTLA